MNVKAWIYAKLIANTALMAALGSSAKLFYFHPNDFTTLPVMSYSDSSHGTTGYQDDVPLAVESVMEFDIYSASSTSSIFDALVAAMTGLYFNLDFAADLYETDTKVHHKNCRFRRTLRAEDLI